MEYYTKGNPVYDFWNALVKHNAVVKSGKILKFSDGVTDWGWCRDVEELYERDCYISTMNKLNNNVNMAIIDGTPGIGKTMFLFYYIYEKVRQSREKNESIPSFAISDRDGREYFLRSNPHTGIAEVLVPRIEWIPTYIITDTVGISNLSFTVQYIHISSINIQNTEHINNLNTQYTNIITMNLPVFSLEEYIECDCKDIQERNNCDFLYEVFGGSLHNLRAASYMDEISPYPDETYIIIKKTTGVIFW